MKRRRKNNARYINIKMEEILKSTNKNVKGFTNRKIINKKTHRLVLPHPYSLKI